ncbi:hypothetical protein TUM19329_27920 [Legionella antarctica]|uniref:Uncharacterized protein n=1 Tax=Legionella antarctica TaxID=2708020 RepID=A0A6F8T7K3_9GAMM|nr:hypothetical protein [Legionella antarctica]BCA96431.1 hypothetical protein TUM19329_27920 [Legionella antarctica]
MPSYVSSGTHIFVYDFPHFIDEDFIPPPPPEIYPTVNTNDDNYNVESNRFSEYVKAINVAYNPKMAWMMSAVPTALESIEDVISLRQICDYFNTGDYWKKNGDWPQEVSEEQLRIFNIEVLKKWLFQKTARHFYAQNQDTLPNINEYKQQLIINLEQFKQELLALDAFSLMKSCPKTYLAELWQGFNPGSSPEKLSAFNSSAVIQLIKEKELFPDSMQLNIHPDSFEYWQTIHRSSVNQLLAVINTTILDQLRQKCAEYCSNVPFEQLYESHWPTSKRLDDNTPPLRLISEINEFMEKIILVAEQQHSRIVMIEDMKKKWEGSPAGFDVAIERTHSETGSKQIDNEAFFQILSVQLKKIADEDTVLESLSLVNTNPIQLVTQMMKDEHVDHAARLAPVIVRDIQHVIEHMTDKPAINDNPKNVLVLDQFVVNVRSACNRAALIDLYDRLESIAGKEKAELMICDWDVIGTDIRDSHRMMTESDKLRIIAYAQGEMTLQQYNEEMAKLTVKLKQGEVTAQEEVVIKMFPKLKRALTQLSKEYFEDFSLVLKRAFVHQQIAHPEKFLQNPHEMAVFSALGLDPNKIKVNKELVQQKIKHVIQNAVLNGQAENEIPTLKELQHQIELMALKEKIIAAGGEPSLVPLIHMLTKARQEILSTASDLIEQESEKCKKKLNDSNENISQHIESSLQRSKSRLLHTLGRFIDKKITDNKDRLAVLTDQYVKVKEVLSPSNGMFSSHIQTMLPTDVNQDIEFFKVWGNPIQYENIQGFIGGDCEILGNGVCQANAYRVITREMTSIARNETLSDLHWKAEVKISPQDRYTQALYQVDVGIASNNGLSQAVLKRLHLKKIQQLHADARFADEPAFSCTSIYQVLYSAVTQQQKSKLKNSGIIKISIGHQSMKKDGTQTPDEASWGHAIFLRYDPKKKTAYFYDPNHGRSINFYMWKKLESDGDFKKMSQKDQDEVVLNYMLSCFSQMIVNDFDDINSVRCFEMEMDTSVIDKLFNATNKIIGGVNNFFKKRKDKEPESTGSINEQPLVIRN